MPLPSAPLSPEQWERFAKMYDITLLTTGGRAEHINGTIDVYNQCLGEGNCIALVNFWRSMSNLTINAMGKGGCQSGEFWAVSQAAPMRRVQVNGAFTLMDYCTNPSFASGGFIADYAASLLGRDLSHHRDVVEHGGNVVEQGGQAGGHVRGFRR